MLKKPHRLRETSRFVAVRKEGRSVAHPLLVLGYLPNDTSVSRFGFAVSRRVGGAVERNRVKRLLREAIRRRLGSIRPGYDVVFVARPPVRTADFRQVDDAVARLLSRAQLLQSEPASADTNDRASEV
jgi:ribonuclease P protein component